MMDDTRLQAAQEELMRQHWDVFRTEALTVAHGGTEVIVPGCVACRKLLYTSNQYLSHLSVGCSSKCPRTIFTTRINNSSRFDWMPSLRWLRCRGLGGRDASFLPAHKHLHGVLALARFIGVFKGVL